MLRFVVLILSVCLAQGCASVSKINQSGTWHFLPINDNLSLTSDLIVESGKLVGFGATITINILCKYGVSSISNDCMTSFVFTRYPDNYGTFQSGIKTIPTQVDFVKNGLRDSRQINLYPLKNGGLMVSPDQVDMFLSKLATSEQTTINLKWRIIKATHDEDHSSTFTFKLNKTSVAIGRFKNMVLDRSPAKVQQPSKPKKKVSEIVADYI